MSTARLLIAALAFTPALIACDSKPEPGDEGSGTEVAASEGDGETAAETTEGETTEGETTEGESTEGESTESGTTSEPVPADSECTGDLVGRNRACAGGVQFCASDLLYPSETYFWGPCLGELACEPGESDACGMCRLGSDGVPFWNDTCQEGGTTTPLVLNFGGDPVRFHSSAASFDLGPACGATDWPTAATPWLALDRDGSGAIEAGSELFGSATVLGRGVLADNGFTALAALDHNRDGRITAADPAFSRLLLWADHDADRRSTAWELTPLADLGVIAIGLTYREDARCDDRSNCEVERAAFTFRDALGRERVGEIVDVHLSCQ